MAQSIPWRLKFLNLSNLHQIVRRVNCPMVSPLDVVRSMMRAGFSHEEIYDVLTGVGLPGEQLQLLIDRVSADFNSAEMESRPSRLAVEVEKIIQKYSTGIQYEIAFRMEVLTGLLEMMKLEIEKLSYLITAGRRLKKQDK